MICGAMFARIEAGQSRATQLADATRAALAVLVILVVTALIGAKVLTSLPPFPSLPGAITSTAVCRTSAVRRG
jgi:hypothetical protein